MAAPGGKGTLMKEKFRNYRARVTRGGATLAAVIGLVFAVGVAPASAHPLDGTDPAGTGCASGSVVIYSQALINGFDNSRIGTMEVRYSPTCGTNWVRVDNWLGYNAHKTIFIVGGASDDEDDWGPGWSYGMQIYAPGSTCIYAYAHIDDGFTVLASTGNVYIC